MNRHLIKIGSKIFKQRLLSSPSRNPASPLIPRNNIGTNKKTSLVPHVRYLVYGAVGSIMIGTGSTLTYAKYDPKFRESLKAHTEIMDNAIKFIWQEDQTFLERFKHLVGNNRIDSEVNYSKSKVILEPEVFDNKKT